MDRRADAAHPLQGPSQLRRIEKHELQAVVACLQDQDVDLRMLAERIAAHSGLQAFVVAAANAVCHGLEYRVRDVRHAVVVLGVRRLLALFDDRVNELERTNVA